MTLNFFSKQGRYKRAGARFLFRTHFFGITFPSLQSQPTKKS